MKREDFTHPRKEYRAVPFWSWNDDLQVEELRRQIELMDEAGWGGFFMHSRVGLVTPYLSERWMKCVRACVDEARRRSMGAWLYDEDKWPSGFAGGLVPALGPEYRAKALVCLVDDKPTVMPEAIATFAGRLVEGHLKGLRRIMSPAEETLNPGEVLLHFYVWIQELGHPWFRGYSYVDTLNPDAVRAFLDSTYVRYSEEVGDDFGTVVPGIFTDEPCYLWWNDAPRPSVPWTTDFPRYFEEQMGYSIIGELPALFFDVDDYPRVRYDFWRTITQLFRESYTEQVYRWCEANNLAYTGHYMSEDSMLGQIRWIGAAMPHYEYMHIPGVDKLGRNIEQVITIKQVDSVAQQLGKPRTLCEAYGCVGQAFSFAGRKWIGDWLYVLGVNLLNPHLSLYSMRGERKRDYPANLFYQQPWWRYNRLIADYFARLSYALTQGERVVDILVIHPMSSAWIAYSPRGAQGVKDLDRALVTLSDHLLSLHRDYHFGDESLMARHGSVRDVRLLIGQIGYRVVIVPPGITLASTTVELLHQFAQAGGKIIAIEPLPMLIDGREQGEVLPKGTHIISNEREALARILNTLLPPDVQIADAPQVWYHHRRTSTQEIYFLVNTHRSEGTTTTVRVRADGAPQEWDPLTGESTPLPHERSKESGYLEMTLHFPPTGSHLLVVDRNAHVSSPDTSAHASRQVVQEIRLGSDWAYHREDPNALVLDYCRYRIGDAEWSPVTPVWKAHNAIVGAGLGQRFVLEFTFDVLELPKSKVELVLERPERFDIRVNGQHISALNKGYWRDISFRRMDICKVIRGGKNLIEIEGTVRLDTELENCYIIGDFGVTSQPCGRTKEMMGQRFSAFADRFQIVRERETLHSGDLVAQGYPFFAGILWLSQEIELPPLNSHTCSLMLNDLQAVLAEVRINGQTAGQILWPPHELNITHWLKPGLNRVEIGLVGSLRNLLGPHHKEGGDGPWTGPGDFRDETHWTDDYWLVPFGLGGARLLISRKVECER